jgi:hypothetical protein
MMARRGLLDGLACFVMGAAVGIIPWLFRHRFYFHDDMQHQHMPIFLHIGRMLRAGEMPILSLASFSSGNLLGEYQFAVMNPVSLALYSVLPSIPSLETGAAFLACFFYGVLASGTYALARAHGVERPGAGMAALVMATNNLIAYWFAASWFPVFVSLAWFVWAWAFLARAHSSRLDWALAVVFCYLTITSGWPQTTIMLGLACVLVALQTWRSEGTYRAATPLAALLAATLLASMTLLALTSVTEVAARYRGVMNNNVFVPNLRDLLAMSSPFHRGFMSWGGYKLTGTPIFFLAWFVIPLLPLIEWRRVDWRRPELLTLLVLAGLSLFATQGPEEFYMVRWPFRYVPYFHIALLVLFMAVVSRAGFARPTPARILWVALLVVLTGLSSLQADPGGWPLHLSGMVGCAVAAAVFLLTPERARTIRFVWLGAVSLAFFAATHAQFRLNADVPDWGLPAAVETELAANSAPGAYTMYLGWLGHPADTGRLEEYRTGMMPRVRETAMINGYTPIGHRAGSDFLCMNMFGETCPEGIPRLFEREPDTGVPYVDLLRIDRLTAMKGPHLDRLLTLLDETWRLESAAARTQRYARELPNAGLPGTVSWVSPGAALESAREINPTREEVRIARPEGQPTTVVFARLWWPGYQAEFNGEPLATRVHAGFLVAVDVPAGAGSGILTLRFRPPRFSAGIAGVAGGLALCLAVLIFWPSGWSGKRRPLQATPPAAAA